MRRIVGFVVLLATFVIPGCGDPVEQRSTMTTWKHVGSHPYTNIGIYRTTDPDNGNVIYISGESFWVVQADGKPNEQTTKPPSESKQ